MYIFTFILGLTIGIMGKIGIDYYKDFIIKQEKTASKMEEVLTNWRAMELAAKERKDWQNITHGQDHE